MYSFPELKKLAKHEDNSNKYIRLAVLADTASQFLTIAIKGYGKAAGIDFDIYEADYNQVDQEVLNPASGLYSFSPEYVLIVCTSEKLLKTFYKTDPATRTSFADGQVVHTDLLYRTVKERMNSRVIISSFAEINDNVFGNFSAKQQASFTYQVRSLNVQLMDLCRQHKDLHLCDVAALQSQHGYHQMLDPKMYVNADMAFSLDFLPHIAQAVTGIISSVAGNFKKCVILDLDNTLWGGIIGDDGIEGIQLGDLGIGKAFSEFQLWLSQLKQRGIILAVCSKNTEHIAREAFEKHPDMVLRMEDIAIFVANWENKVDNIRYIQSVLNIGFDSMVFFDDNPFEREMVKQAIPGITVPDLPEDPAEYLVYIRTLNLFETASFTEEDGQRTQLYRQEAQRVILQKTFDSEEAFLESLEMEADVNEFNTFNAPRVAQLTQRSNQFNLRTVRYTEEDILNIAARPGNYTMAVSLKDKFGDHGLISVIILKESDPETLFIDTWIMSCRVLKRGMEQFTLDAILSVAVQHGYKRILGEYIETKKNGLVKDHYRDLGFTAADSSWVCDVLSHTTKKFFIKAKSIV